MNHLLPQDNPVNPLNVLSLEDSEPDFLLIKNKLEKSGYALRIEQVDNEKDFLQKVSACFYNIILADFRLPGFDAFGALDICNTHCPDTPFVCVSGAIGEETAIELLKKGAVDFVMKDKLDRLPFVVDRALEEADKKKAHKRAEMHASLAYKILSQLNSITQFGETIDLILNMIRDVAKIETVGIRLKHGDDYPFFSQRGMDKDFLATENSLLAKDEDHHICRDENGNILLECICGQVIAGKFNPENSNYTKGGSFWTNDSSLFAELSKPFNNIINPRNVCINKGYLSMAIIPIRAEQETVGLLQLNDRQRNRFTPDMIRFYESIGIMIGVAFMRRQAQEDLKKSHDLLFKLSEQVPGVIYQYQLFPDGTSCFPYASSGMNMIYEVTPEEVRLDASPAFGRLHPDDLQRVTDLIFESARDLSYFYCEFRVKLPKQGVKWRYCTAVPEKLSDNSVLWHGIIWDITKLKETEKSLTTKMEELQRFHNLTVDRELFMIELKKEINELLKNSGLPAKYKIVE